MESATKPATTAQELNISSELMREHQLILRVLEHLQPLLNSQNTERLFMVAPLFVDFVEEFADKFHHAKEENILFEALNQPGVLSHCNPVGQMCYEHDLGRQAVAKMKQAIGAQQANAFIEGARQYADLLQQHIFKEDNILYPMAEKSLPDEVKKELLTQYQNIWASHKGEEIWQKFEAFAEQLAAL